MGLLALLSQRQRACISGKNMESPAGLYPAPWSWACPVSLECFPKQPAVSRCLAKAGYHPELLLVNTWQLPLGRSDF